MMFLSQQVVKRCDECRSVGSLHVVVTLIVIVLSSLVWGGDASLAAGNPIFPADAQIADVTQAPYLAKGDGLTDDTAALNRAFDDNDFDGGLNVDRSSPRTVYLPAGTYLVSARLYPSSSTLRIVGAGVGKTIIKLADSSLGFTDSNSPKPVLQPGSWYDPVLLDHCQNGFANCSFGNFIENITVDVGSGNHGAIGVRYDVANFGAMRNVEIKTSDPSGAGAYGLAFQTSPGPAYIDNVTVTGFNYGIYCDSKSSNVLTFSDISLTDQRVAAIYNVGKTMVMERLTTTNSPLAIQTVNSSANISLINSELSGQGTGPAIDISQQGFLYTRNLTASKFASIVSVDGVSQLEGTSSLSEWSTADYQIGSEKRSWIAGAVASLNLEIKQPPVYNAGTNMATWVNATDFHEVSDGADYGPALQRAVDSGAESIYLPYGAYLVDTPVEIRGGVRLIDFMFSQLYATNRVGPDMTIGQLNGPDVHLQNGNSTLPIVHNTDQTVVIEDLKAIGGVRTGPDASGDLFVSNPGAHFDLDIAEPVHAWLRSIDRSGEDWLNDGGSLWVLSSNIETDFASTSTINGGSTEIIGAKFDSLSGAHPISEGALFQSVDSRISVVGSGAIKAGTEWQYVIHDQSELGATDVYFADTLLSSDGRTMTLPLYVTPEPVPRDTTAPVITILAPTAVGSVVNSSLNIVDEVQDDSEIVSNAYAIDNGAYTEITAKLWGAPFAIASTVSLSEGAHQLIVRAEDVSGNASTVSATFTVDHTPPSMMFLNPTVGNTISGTKQVVAKMTDANWQSKVSLKVDGITVAKNMDPYFTANYYFLDTTKYRNGQHTLTITGTDKANNTSSLSISVQFVN